MKHQKSSWVLEPTHCKIGFRVKHFGIAEVEGHFKKFSGTGYTASGDFSDVTVDFLADVNSISTDVEQRDKHLSSVDFFDSEKNPQIRFKSSSVHPDSLGNFMLIGELTMRGITKEVCLNVNYNGTIEKDPFGNTIAGFKVTGIIDRRDWNISWNTLLDHGGLAVSNEVQVTCHVELKKRSGL